jgi:hypothetical protein
MDNKRAYLQMIQAIADRMSVNSFSLKGWSVVADGTVVHRNGFLVFTKDAECSSPSAAAVVVHGGSANGLTAWKSEGGSRSNRSTNRPTQRLLQTPDCRYRAMVLCRLWHGRHHEQPHC